MGAVDEALARFARLLAPDGDPVELDEAALAMSAVLRPGLDVLRWMVELDELAAACPSPTRDGVVAHLFGPGRFAGDRATYGSWRNSCLDHVIATGRGIPITLSVVAIEVARRVGVPLVGVGMPAHFLVGDRHDADWFVDPFDGGRVLDREGCRRLLDGLVGDRLRWQDGFLAPSANRAIVARMLNNVKAGFADRRDGVRLALVMRMRQAMPEITGEDSEAARAQAVLN